MKTIFATIFLGLLTFIGINQNGSNLYDAGANNLMFGATSYPASLDSFTNPGATDSVATVSHSSQHSDANDAIEAIQAKLGTRASTPLTDSVLVGLSTLSGTSIWSTYATTTHNQSVTLTTTGLGTLQNLLVNGSSTLQNFTFKNATGTQATTTNFAVSSLSSQIPYANSGGSFIPLTIGSGLDLTGGTLTTSGGASSFSTTSVQAMGTTTATFVLSEDVLKFSFVASTSAAVSTMKLYFNGDESNGNYGCSEGNQQNAQTSCNATNRIDIGSTMSGQAGQIIFITATIHNVQGVPKTGTYQVSRIYPSGGKLNQSQNDNSYGVFGWHNTTSKITSISVSTGSAVNTFDTGTFMKITGQ